MEVDVGAGAGQGTGTGKGAENGKGAGGGKGVGRTAIKAGIGVEAVAAATCLFTRLESLAWSQQGF